MDFPVYRKMIGFNKWYKILSNDTFVEVGYIGHNKVVHLVEAKQYPEKLRIMDMLHCEPPFEEFIPDTADFFT